MNGLDYLAAAILGYGFLYGFRKGAFELIFGYGAYAVGVFTATTSYKLAAAWLDSQTGAVLWLQGKIIGQLKMPDAVYRIKVDMVPNMNVQRFIKDLPLPEYYKNAMIEKVSDLALSPPAGVFTFADLLANYVAASLWNMAVFAGLVLGIGVIGKQLAVLALRAVGGNPEASMAGRTFGGLLSLGIWGSLMVLALGWFFQDPPTSSLLRTECEPLKLGSSFMPHILWGYQILQEQLTYFTFR